MPSTYSTSLKIELIADGEQAGTWGDTTNKNLGTLLEQAITGVATITMTDADYTLSNLNGLSDEARNAVIIATRTYYAFFKACFFFYKNVFDSYFSLKGYISSRSELLELEKI